jgi:chemotaxis protein MotB
MGPGRKNGDVRVIVKKKKVKGHEHHGGAWKVAYADFVTAMMAFFLVMWIMGMDPEVKAMVQGYFSNPIGFEQGRTASSNMLPVGRSPSDVSAMPRTALTRKTQQRRFEQARSTMEERLREQGIMEGIEAAVSISVTEQGLRVELMETGPEEKFFDKASFQLKPALQDVLAILGGEFGRLGNPVVVEGHTDALPFVGRPGYTNWELSVERANAARRVLVSGGLDDELVQEVRGYADRRLRNAGDPLDRSNRRISVLLPYQSEIRSQGVIPVEECTAGDASPECGGIVPGSVPDPGR